MSSSHPSASLGLSLPPFRLALIAMPWTPFNRPSIQLGALKAYLKDKPGIEIDALHPFLEIANAITPATYHFISRDSWISEALYSSILFPDHADNAEKMAMSRLKTKWKKNLPRFDFRTIAETLDSQLTVWAEGIDWSQYRLLGFTVCFNQLLASLAAAARIKKKFKDIPIVFGGSSCVGSMGNSLLIFPQIDYVVPGEGEIPLLELCESLRNKTKQLPPSIFSRQQTNDIHTCPEQISDLNALPLPDYDDYFREVAKTFGHAPFIPVLPVEFSRGCWWEKCAFCNLNLQWKGYRRKRAQTMVEQVTSLSHRYRILDFFFTDNALPPKEADTFFTQMATQKKDIQFFAEIRATTRAKTLATWRRGGLTSIQVGIESLSTSLLQKINKGVTAIENIAAMKHALQQGIELEGNLIIEFPGTTVKEIEKTAEALDFVLPFPPLAVASFFLGHGSPVQKSPEDFGVLALTAHPGNRALFPKDILDKLTPLIKGYRGDRAMQKRLWKPVLRKVAAWRCFHEERRTQTRTRFALSFRDGHDFLIIRQERPGKPALHHRLQGSSRAIYLACENICSLDELAKRFPSLAKEKIRTFLQSLSEKRLLFIEDEKCLALALHDTMHSTES